MRECVVVSFGDIAAWLVGWGTIIVTSLIATVVLVRKIWESGR